MIQPYQRDDQLLADVQRSAAAPPEGFRVWWLGQSGFLVQWQRQHLLFDPYLSDSLTNKYADTDKPHVRMTERVIAPEHLDFVDVVTSSHNHTDHLDAETLGPMRLANPSMQIVVPTANRGFASERLGVDADRLIAIDAGENITLGGFRLHAVPAAHETVARDSAGRCQYLGYIAEFGGWTIYHSGDTMFYDGMVAELQPWSIDLALLPINGRAPQRRVAGNLWGREAATLAHEIGAKQVVPCHYEMFTFNTESPDEFVSTCESLGQPYTVLRAGESFDGAASGSPIA